ncbi:MAG: DEAD/DEAH box helicase [Methylococcaceae bacterium]|nr:DEAD/DEAH box helicase [Methylococcaceae bacterium]
MPTHTETILPLFIDLPLHSTLLEAAAKQGYTTATAVQSQTLTPILEGHDVLVSAATGSGKTAAFLLPTMDRLLNAETHGTRILILVPTRELAQQITDHCQQLAAFTTLKTGLITGGADFKKQQQHLLRQSDIIIATPGRLHEHLEATPDVFKNLEVLILDEADRMLDMGFSLDVLRISDACRGRKQTLLFSATLGHPAVLRIAATIMNEPATIALSTVQDQHQDIQQQVVACDDHAHKQKVLTWLLENETYDKAIIFTNTKLRADHLRGPLRGQKLRVGVLHGDLDQTARNQVMGLYRDGTINILITTDVAGRGLDIKGIELVINFDMPRTAHHYVHRIGRTGRIGEQGMAIALVSATEWNLMTGIERYLKQRFVRRTIKAVTGNFTGPKKLKSSGKAASAKQKAPIPKKTDAKKPKQRERVTKNIGKRRLPTTSNLPENEAS